MSKISNEIKEKTKEMADGGYSISEIAKATGATYIAVFFRLRHWGLKARSQRDPEHQEFYEAICKTWQENDTTLQQCGDQFGITRERVRQILNVNGINSSKRKWSCKAKINEIGIDKLKTLYRDGFTVKEIAKLHELSANHISRLVNFSFDKYAYEAHKKARFWRDVDIRSKNKCWNHNGKIDPRPKHIRLRWNRNADRLQNVAWQIIHGEKASLILTTCRNVRCVNPDHLFQGNSKQAAQKRKQKSYRQFSESQIQLIRKQLHQGLSVTEIAQTLNVSYSTITKIKHGVTYTKYI